ncbi:3-deoxy-D-manno-octulosonic acid transferase [Roseovarius sp. SCSIO 43702]|uniref:3-deoxy-D-manno-octulosonic acid transferase n=1 Tax=Roseovarius sp. SCSIO 43702 TaxID=2823043 RepID=UPI002175ABC1|nr:3-deoxy-D-manno-octulosonic acid transferase [Roseovarius sp. SCSIO 43702]
MALWLYSGLAPFIARAAWGGVRRKLTAGGTDPARFRERLGHATAPRPEGRLLWFHAASVGESLSILRLIEHMGARDPDLSFLITSGTATSGAVLSKRLPPRTIHQFAPLDTRAALRRFLAHWHPDAGLFVESELWPHMIEEADAAGVPLGLVNARISDASARGWRRFAGSARHILGHFRLIHCQDIRTEQHLRTLGLDHARAGGNLKAASGPAPFDAAELDALHARLGARPVWVASSTHPGEEEIVLAAHRQLLVAHPDLLLILVPRHPDRAGAIMAAGTDMIPTWHRRSTDGAFEPSSQVYIADTMGETGLWYALAPIVFLGGSLTPVGGHNPYEPAHAGAVVLHGPLYANFAQAYAEIDAHGGGVEVRDAPEMADQIRHFLTDRQALDNAREKSRDFARAQTEILDDMATRITAALLEAPS